MFKFIILIVVCSILQMMCFKENQTVETTEDQTVSWLRSSVDGKLGAPVEVGSFFVTKRNTVYGADCKGCTMNDGIATTASSIEVTTESVRQSNGHWKKGITYDGYYLIAADSSIPIGTIVQISEHTYSGAGIEKDQPFFAIVVDRGSMIQENCVDLFAGSEINTWVTHDVMSGAVVEIVGFMPIP